MENKRDSLVKDFDSVERTLQITLSATFSGSGAAKVANAIEILNNLKSGIIDAIKNMPEETSSEDQKGQ